MKEKRPIISLEVQKAINAYALIDGREGRSYQRAMASLNTEIQRTNKEPTEKTNILPFDRRK